MRQEERFFGIGAGKPVPLTGKDQSVSRICARPSSDIVSEAALTHINAGTDEHMYMYGVVHVHTIFIYVPIYLFTYRIIYFCLSVEVVLRRSKAI